MKYDLILKYAGHTAEGEVVRGYGRFDVLDGSLDEKGEFTPAGLQAAIAIFEENASKTHGKSVFCDTITITTVRENGKVLADFPRGFGKHMYDSGWRDPSVIGAVKP